MHSLRPSPAPGAPLQYAVDATAGTLAIDLLRIDNESDLVASLQRITTDAEFRQGLDVYVDCNSLRRIPSSDDVRRLAQAFVRVRRPEARYRCALIATWRPLHDAARFFATIVSAPKISLRVFHTWTEARVWFAVMPELTDATGPLPWLGPSPALNELMRRTRVVGR